MTLKAALITILAAMIPAFAGAQAWLTTPCVESDEPLYPVPTTAPKPVCLPAPQGAGSLPVVETNGVGVAVAWWCKGSSLAKPPLLYLYAVRWDYVSTGLVTDLLLGALSSSKTSAIQTTLKKHQNSDIRDMCDVWGPAVERIRTSRPAS